MPSSQCQTLLAIVGMDIFRRNPFRLLGLDVDAKNRKVRRQEKELIAACAADELAEEYGDGLRPRPLPTREEISQAARELADPQRRLIYEFFWFWPVAEDGEGDEYLAALAAGNVGSAQKGWTRLAGAGAGNEALAAKHNLAVLGHYAALEWELALASGERRLTPEYEQEADRYWKLAFENWERLCGDGGFWSLLAARAQALGDPRLTGRFVRDFETSLPIAFDNMNADLAVAFCKRGMYDRARHHVQFMKETNAGDDDVDASIRRVTVPLLARIDDAIAEATRELVRHKTAGKQRCLELFDTARDTMLVLEVLLGEEANEFTEAADRVATGMLQCQVAYASETEDWRGSIPLLEGALGVARGAETLERIQENLKIVRGNATQDLCWFCSTNAKHASTSFAVKLTRKIYWRDVRMNPEKYQEAVQGALTQVLAALKANPAALMNGALNVVGLMSSNLADKVRALSMFIQDGTEVMTQTSTTTVPRCAICAARHDGIRRADDQGTPDRSVTKPFAHYRKWPGVADVEKQGLVVTEVAGKPPAAAGAPSGMGIAAGWIFVALAALLTYPVFPFSGWVALLAVFAAFGAAENSSTPDLTPVGKAGTFLLLANIVRGIVHLVNH